MEDYSGNIDVEFEGMPSIRLETFKTSSDVGTLERLAVATRRRRFSLDKDWEISLNDIEYSSELNGKVQIPSADSAKKTIVFDGASIPLPWFVSLLTVGILRPLGVILVGSIVHDYAYKFGTLRVSKNDKSFVDVQVSRDRADRLFRDIVGTVNRLPYVGYIAWFFVRIGWLWVKYNGKRFGGKPPVAEYVVLVLIVLAIWWQYTSIGLGGSVMVFAGVYALLYIASLVVGRKRRQVV